MHISNVFQACQVILKSMPPEATYGMHELAYPHIRQSLIKISEKRDQQILGDLSEFSAD
jgi:hypothetical protein